MSAVGQEARSPVLTEDLLDELLFSSSVGSFLDTHSFAELSLAEYLQTLLDAKGLAKAEVIKRSELNETFGYQIFSGDRHPSRDKVLPLIFALNCTVREAQRLLRAAGVNELYPRNRRDVIIIFHLEHGLSLREADEALYRYGEDTITQA